MAVEATATTAVLDRRQSMDVAGVMGASSRAPWLLCRGATHLYAIAIEHVVEIMRALPIEAVSGAPRYVCGLCIIRGSPVPVVDIGLLIGDQATRFERLVTIRTGGGTIALAVETVVGIRNVGADTLGRLPPLLGRAVPEAIEAIGAVDAELLIFLRAARIVPEDLFDRLDIKGASS